ncbi:endopeptidase La, partial [Candidatus Dependentiae bacterium]
MAKEKKELTKNTLSLLPLKNVVMLPKSIIPIIVGRPASVKAVEFALKNDSHIFITSQRQPSIENPTKKDIFRVGTKSTIVQVMRMPNGSLKILAEGVCRAQIISIEEDEECKKVICKELATKNDAGDIELTALWRQLKMLYIAYTKLNEKAPIELAGMVKSIEDMDYITDTIAIHINLSFEERQGILETLDLQERMLKVCGFLKKEIEILQTEKKIRGRIQTQVEKNQKEYYLNEQMKAIQKELGREDHISEIYEIRDKSKKLGLSKEAQEKLEKELQRLEQMPPLSSEAVVSRHYVDWLTTLPWKKETKDKISIDQAEKILDQEHFGLKKPKERIIEFLAAKKFSKDLQKSPIICLVGPPGVGKTSLAQSVAKSLGRNFVRISLGGIRDEAEIRGHRRTYIGALPGKIIQAIKKSKVVNPVILLDEIDKMSQDIHGDPSSALLEVLDPEQNKSFVDHFLDLNYDLSKVMFITTANMIDTISYPLFDRMEIINLSGYTDEEKAEIAKKFLIPKNLKEHGLQPSQFKIDQKELLSLISEYTREAGVRQLERTITKLMRKTIQHLLKNPKVKNISINA